MTPAIKQAAVNMAMRIADLFVQNCALKHGVPNPGVSPTIDFPEEVPTPPVVNNEINVPPPTVINNSTSPEVGATVAPSAGSSLAGKVAPYLLTLASAGFGASIPVGLYSYLNQEEPSVEMPLLPNDGSLLQYLQDQGQHLPEGQWPTQPQTQTP